MTKYILIGGGDIGRANTEYQTKEIDEEIVKTTSKTNPTFLFIGLASSHSDSYYNTIKKIYQNLGCKTSYLKKSNLINNPNIVKKKIKESDIIYIGGGDTIKLLDYIKKYKLDNLLEEIKDQDKVIVGISAGAIVLSKEGYSDSYILRNESNNYHFIKGLNYINLSICPHYETTGQKREQLINELKNNNKKVISLPDKTALKITNNLEIITSTKNKNIYLCYYENNTYKEEIITNENIDKKLSVIKKDF